jgi:hypothetical protein
MFGENGASGSNPAWTTIQSISFGTYRRIAGKARVCAGLCAHAGPEKAPNPRFAAESGKTYPVAILVGPSWRQPKKGGVARKEAYTASRA